MMDRYGNLPDLDSLRCFVEAARFLNFRAASRAVGLTPAALGQRIQKLEEQLEVKLFHRTTRKVEPTEAALALLPAARKALDAAWECAQAARGELGPTAIDLRLGTRHELGLSWITPMLSTLREAHPSITLHLYFGSGPDLELRVRTQEIDCAVSSRRLSDPHLDGIRLHREDYLLVAASSLLSRQPFEVAEHARDHVLVDIGEELPLFGYFRDAPDAVPLEFNSFRAMGTIAAIRSVVCEGHGVGVLPEYLIRSDLKSGALVPLLTSVTMLHDYFRLIHRRDDPRIPVFRALAATMQGQELG